jgi:hypothetical protein
MEKNNLMGDSSRDRFPYLSRDWEDIDCLAKLCQYNISFKCTVPSIAVIGEDGKCKGFKILDAVKDENIRKDAVKLYE